MGTTWLLILGDQLFDPQTWTHRLEGRAFAGVYMREDRELCARYKFHKQKLVFFIAAMRTFADELRSRGIAVHYESFDPACPGAATQPVSSETPYEDRLVAFLKKSKARTLAHFEIEDAFFESRLLARLESEGIGTESWTSPMFLTDRTDYEVLMPSKKRPFMKTFYELQRKRLGVLLDDRGGPVGGQWSFDAENRKPLPTKIEPPPMPNVPPSAHIRGAQALCEREFADHPGSSANAWLPVDRAGARQWLKAFIDERLAGFGPYEDALAEHSDFVYHSALTPLLNSGLLMPAEVLDAVLSAYEAGHAPLASTEGFVRQIIGWREFIRGIYRAHGPKQEKTNFFGHERKLAPAWYEGDTGLPPLDAAIGKTLKYGYAHHIERLMVIGNLMLLLEIEPRAAHRWFMEMYIDSAEWVMGPNVYGMALFSDGGTFATKPYICGSNYYGKMGPYKTGEWKNEVDGLYWGFVEKHRAFFLKNPRLSMAVRTVEKMDPARKKLLRAAADRARERLTR